MAGAALAQSPFTIVRPADGSRVREKVKVLIPKGSIPSGGYVGVFLNDTFLEAVLPPLSGKYYVYTLDTKGRKLEDTPAGKADTLKLVLYAESDSKARIVDQSSVDLRIANYSNIPVPNAGLNLRYKFVPGQELIYNLTQKISVNQATEDQLNRGGKAGTIAEQEGERLRISYSVVNSYGNGDGLLRLQPLPMKGKDYADYTVDPGAGAQRFYDGDMDSIYMRVTSTGHEVFGALPPYVPMEGMAGPSVINSLYAAFPLPTLPSKSVRPGDSWQSRFQQGKLNLENRYEIDSVVSRFPARGEFVRVEWERSHPCAVIRNVIEEGTSSLDKKKIAGDDSVEESDKIGVTETIWFAMDTRKILKIVRDVTLDRKADAQTPGLGGSYGGGRPGGPPNGYPGGPGGPPGGWPGGNGPSGLGRPGGGGDTGKDFSTGLAAPIGIKQRGKPGVGGGRPGGPPGGFPGAPGGFPGGMQGRGGMGGGLGGGITSATVTRIHIVQTFTLEE